MSIGFRDEAVNSVLLAVYVGLFEFAGMVGYKIGLGKRLIVLMILPLELALEEQVPIVLKKIMNICNEN